MTPCWPLSQRSSQSTVPRGGSRVTDQQGGLESGLGSSNSRPGRGNYCQLSQFRCQVLNTAGLQPETAQIQSHRPAPCRSGPKHPHLHSSEQTPCKAQLRADTVQNALRATNPGPRRERTPTEVRHTAQCPPTTEPQCWESVTLLSAWGPVRATDLCGRTRDLGILLTGYGPGHSVAQSFHLCFLPLCFLVKIYWRNPHLSTR